MVELSFYESLMDLINRINNLQNLVYYVIRELKENKYSLDDKKDNIYFDPFETEDLKHQTVKDYLTDAKHKISFLRKQKEFAESYFNFFIHDNSNKEEIDNAIDHINIGMVYLCHYFNNEEPNLLTAIEKTLNNQYVDLDIPEKLELPQKKGPGRTKGKTIKKADLSVAEATFLFNILVDVRALPVKDKAEMGRIINEITGFNEKSTARNFQNTIKNMGKQKVIKYLKMAIESIEKSK